MNDKLELSELYALVQETLRPGYDPNKGEVVKILTYQTSIYYRGLKNFLVPGHAVTFFSSRPHLEPPPRWEEPLTQRYVRSFLKLLSEDGVDNTRLESDPVYANIFNPNVRSAILRRKMKKETYEEIERLLGEASFPPALPEPKSKAMVVTNTSATQLAIREKEVRMKLDSLTPELLSIESELGVKTVQGLLRGGLEGSQVVDLAHTLREKKTSSSLVKRLISSGVDDWSSIIDAARVVGCSVALLLRIMDDIGTSEVEEILGIVDEASTDISDYAKERRTKLPIAWYRFFQIYKEERDLQRALTLLRRGRGYEAMDYDGGEQ